MFERDYTDLVDHVLFNGEYREGRNGGTFMMAGKTLRHNMEDGFPMLTTRKIHWRGVVGELAAFLEGATSLARFKELGCNYWDMNANEWSRFDGDDLGRIYGAQWRGFRTLDRGVDQLKALVDGLEKDPYSRRHVLTTWHPAELDSMCLPPCHLVNQYIAHRSGALDSVVFMRSVDLCLGLPSDLVLYGTLLRLLCNTVPAFYPGQLIFMLGDAHVYDNHIPAWDLQRRRRKKALPDILAPGTVFDFDPNTVRMIDYDPHEAIKYELN